uniref:Uncharacterized protein n=1 Tax=Oryza meridionalis TaxID=40149 RepID=A0A0E0EC69_9ORYZ
MDLGYEHPAVLLSVEISEVVQKLRRYLGKSSDSFKRTTKKLDVVEDKLRFLRLDSLQRVKPAPAWLQDLNKAAQDAKGLLDDMESEVKAPDSSISDVMNWLSSDDRNMIRMVYVISKLASACSQGKSIVDTPPLNESALGDEKEDKIASSSVAMTRQDKSFLGDDFLIGRDEEIAMIRDMVLDNAQYVPTEITLKIREEAEKLHVPHKGWITETLHKIDMSKWTQQAIEVSPHPENEKSNKVEYIRHPHDSAVTYLRNPAVIPIVGISGVGKSALAKFIFDDANVREHFGDISAWVYMTDRTDQLVTIEQIIYSFNPKDNISYMTSLDSAYSQLQDIIEGKRFLLVLDDVWNEICVLWNDLRSVLSKGAPGSVVLVTTQLYSVANFVGTAGPVILDPLQSDDSWALLRRYAFVEPCRSLSTEGLKEIGRKISHRLHGLPLSIKVTGATLRSQLEEADWREILNSWWWNVSDDNFAIRIISSLGSCYSALPGYLRQCFVYCSIFPRNYVFEKDNLVQMWIANGFIQLDSSSGVKRLEDVGGEWFYELVNRAFLQPSARKTEYIIHDLVWDFASALSSDEYHGIDNKVRGVSQDVRYLSVDMDALDTLPDKFKTEQLRTFMLLDGSHQPSNNETHLPLSNFLCNSKSLRLLAFSSRSYKWLGRTSALSNVISSTKHLRYLDLSFTGIAKLPNSVCSLCHLQVLGLRGCTFGKLPGDMNFLINLRHLHASSGTIAQINGIGKLTKLQELHEFHIKAEEGHGITELSDMNDLGGSLCISHLEMVTDPAEALQANIVEKDYITALELRWSYTLPDLSKSILGCLSPPRYLQELKLYGYSGFELPDWVGQLKHVRVVEISWCKNLNVLPPLGQLEHLQKLKLDGLPSIKDINSDICGTSNVVFWSLEELSFEYMENWESWTYAGSSDFIRNLKKLKILSCEKLRKVPFESLGLATKEIIIKWCDPYDDTFSRYLQGLNGLTRLEVGGSRRCKLIIPCKQLMSLEYLHIQGFGDVCIKSGLWYIKNLKNILIIDCSTVVTDSNEESAQEDKQSPTQIDRTMHSLTHLTLGGDTMQKVGLEFVIPQTPSLRNLRLDIVQGHTSITKKWLQYLTSLQELEIYSCHALPSSLSSLSSLRRCTLKYCHWMYSIPPNSLPGNLKELQIEECSFELEARCQNPTGDARPEGRKIELWQKRKMGEWQERKLEHGRTKLIEMQQKNESLGIPMSWREKSPKSSKGESLYQSDKYWSRGQRMQEGHEWPRKQHMEEQSFIEKEKSSSLNEQAEEDESKKEPLEEWLQQSEGDQWPEREWELYSWVERKLKKELDRNKDDPSSLMKEREEWLKEEERKFHSETLGKDWPNICHVPYICVEGKIVQNLYT